MALIEYPPSAVGKRWLRYGRMIDRGESPLLFRVAIVMASFFTVVLACFTIYVATRMLSLG
jgi:hypothetical protein